MDGTSAPAESQSDPDPDSESGSSGAADADAGQPTHPRAVCTVALCPVCAIVTALDEIRPELAEHLILAGREILLVVKAVIESRLNEPPADEPPSGDERQRPPTRRRPNTSKGRSPSRLERIVVD